MPVRSSGCATCRKRKIRCDETRPACRKCAVHGVQCPGYRTEFPGGFEFEDQTAIVMQRASVKQRQSSASQQVQRQSQSGQQQSGLVLQQKNRVNVLAVPPLDDRLDRHPFDDPDACETNAIIAASQVPTDWWNGDDFSPPDPMYPPKTTFVFPHLTQAIFCPALERIRLYDTFIDMYNPREREPIFDPIRVHSKQFQMVLELAERDRTVSLGFDALSLVQVGSTHKDKRLLRQAVQLYGKGVATLSKLLVEGQVKSDAVLSLATMLSLCELYDEIKQEGMGWVSHQQGLAQLLKARGASSLKSDLSMVLFLNARLGNLIQGLIRRKALVFAHPKWRNLAFKYSVQDYSTVFMDNAVQIPGLLQQYDELDHDAPDARAQLNLLVDECTRVEMNLREWKAGWSARMAIEGTVPYKLVPIDDFETFPNIVHNRQLTHAYQYPHFGYAWLLTNYWCCMAILRECIQAQHDKLRDLDPSWLPEDPEREVTESELSGYTFDLCRSFPYLAEPSSSISGHICIFLPLRVAAFHFRKMRMWNWALWIRDTRDSIFNKGVSQPNVGDVVADKRYLHFKDIGGGPKDKYDVSGLNGLSSTPPMPWPAFSARNSESPSSSGQSPPQPNDGPISPYLP